MTVVGAFVAGLLVLFCQSWANPDGMERSGQADCYDQPAGSRFDVRVPADRALATPPRGARTWASPCCSISHRRSGAGSVSATWAGFV